MSDVPFSERNRILWNHLALSLARPICILNSFLMSLEFRQTLAASNCMVFPDRVMASKLTLLLIFQPSFGKLDLFSAAEASHNCMYYSPAILPVKGLPSLFVILLANSALTVLRQIAGTAFKSSSPVWT